MTFRLYDWGNIDKVTGKPRELHIEKGLESITFPQEPVKPVVPIPETAGAVTRERLVDCTHFKLWRVKASETFAIGGDHGPRIVVGLGGGGGFHYAGETYPVRTGEVWLIPAELGPTEFIPNSEVELLEIALPD